MMGVRSGIRSRLFVRGWLFGAVLALCATLFSSAPAYAAFHLMTIQEVFLGPPGDGLPRTPALTPDQRAQYVLLRMTSSGQTFTSGTTLRVEDADGNILGNFGTINASMVNGGSIGCAYPNCPAIVVGTQAAKNLFTFTFDQIVDGQAGRVALPASGGRICFLSGSSLVDCVAWGNFDCTHSGNCSGANTARSGDFNSNGCDTNFGPPAPALKFGFTLTHGTVFNCVAKGSASDYVFGFPKPANNAGTSNNVDADGDGLIDQLDCNDASATILWPATEVQNESVTGKPISTISWSSQAATAGSGVSYDVVRGSLASLNGFSDAACFLANTSTTSTTDNTTPAPGQGRYFLERAGSGAGCVGTYGSGFQPATSRDTVLGPKCP